MFFVFAWALCAPDPAAPVGSLLVLPLGQKGNPDPAIVARINKELGPALGLKLLSDSAAENKGKEATSAVAKRCGPDPSCIASYGRKVQAERVLYGLSSDSGKAVVVDFSLVASLEGAVQARTKLFFSSANDVKKIIQENKRRLLGSEQEDAPALTAIKKSRLLGSEQEDAPALTAIKKSRLLGSEQEDAPALTAIAIKKKKTEPKAQEFVAAPDTNNNRYTAIGTLPPVERVGGGAPTKRLRALQWTGITLAVLGAGGLGVGAYFGVKQQEIGGAVQANTPQIATFAAQEAANRNVLFANLGFVTGGVLLAAGAALFATDIFLNMKGKPALSVSTNGASAGWVMTW